MSVIRSENVDLKLLFRNKVLNWIITYEKIIILCEIANEIV